LALAKESLDRVTNLGQFVVHPHPFLKKLKEEYFVFSVYKQKIFGASDEKRENFSAGSSFCSLCVFTINLL
jgi:hypothetical protein